MTDDERQQVVFDYLVLTTAVMCAKQASIDGCVLTTEAKMQLRTAAAKAEAFMRELPKSILSRIMKEMTK